MRPDEFETPATAYPPKSGRRTFVAGETLDGVEPLSPGFPGDGQYFQKFGQSESFVSIDVRSTNGQLLTAISDRVLRRFHRLTGQSAVGALLRPPGGNDEEDPAENPAHPNCGELARSDYCRESWQLHLVELERRPATHWHRCVSGRLCGVVPFVCQGRCLAACKFVCVGSVATKTFLRDLEILDVLVENSASAHTLVCAPSRPEGGETSNLGNTVPNNRNGTDDRAGNHPAVLSALDYIDVHLSDPRLTALRVAKHVDLSANYLSGLFARAVGKGVKEYILRRRVELAKRLLSSTDWQIKRIAYETGYANPAWFSHTFHFIAGVTPAAYRAEHRPLSFSRQKFARSAIGLIGRALPGTGTQNV